MIPTASYHVVQLLLLFPYCLFSPEWRTAGIIFWHLKLRSCPSSAQNLLWLSFSLRVRSKFLMIVSVSTGSVPCLSPPSTPACLLFLKHEHLKHVSTSGTLHLLVPLFKCSSSNNQTSLTLESLESLLKYHLISKAFPDNPLYTLFLWFKMTFSFFNFNISEN